MDVLDLDEVPDQAIERLNKALQQQAAAQRKARREAPGRGAFLPDDSLGARGLAGVPLESADAGAGDGGILDFLDGDTGDDRDRDREDRDRDREDRDRDREDRDDDRDDDRKGKGKGDD